MTARWTALAGAGSVKSMDTSLGNRKLPRRCPPVPGNGVWAGADDIEPAGRKTVALPFPQADAPVRTPAATNVAKLRRPRMVPPCRPDRGDALSPALALLPAGSFAGQRPPRST